MRKYLLVVCLILFLSFTVFAGPPSPKAVSNTAYDATSWNGVKSKAPSQNAVRDKIETMVVLEADIILESYLKAVDSAADEDILTYESTTGEFEWHTIDELLSADAAAARTAIDAEQADSDIAKINEAETITGNWQLPWLNLDKRTSAPTPIAGQIYYADCTTWDPSGLGIGKAYYVIYDGANYIPWRDEDGAAYFKSIARPSYSHISGGDALYNDNAGGTPYGLLASEVKFSILTNAGAGVNSVYTMPTYESTMGFFVMVVAGYQVDLEPSAGKTIFVNGIEYAANEHIINDDDTEGDLMYCQTVESADGVYDLHCKSLIGWWRGANGDDSWVGYGSNSTTTGFAGDPNPATSDDIYYKVDGSKVCVTFLIVGTSNDTDFTFTLPFTNRNLSGFAVAEAVYIKDNDSWNNPLVNDDAAADWSIFGMLSIPTNSATATINSDANDGTWTNSNSKGARGRFCYTRE